jgi:hypothetical protein
MSIAFSAWYTGGIMARGPASRKTGGGMTILCRRRIGLVAFLAVIGAGMGVSRAQDAAIPLKRIGGHADLSGAWQAPYVPDMTKDGRGQKGEPNLPFTLLGAKEWQSYDAANGDYTGSCLPFGLSRSMNAPNPMQIMQSETSVAFLFEIMNWFHIVPTDGRAQPNDPDPQWFGHSVGRWEGDTLIVDTMGFNGWTRLDTVGHPHSNALHLTQTFRRTDAEHIAYTMTVNDPTMYTRPWKNERTFTKLKGDLIEYSCEENNKDLREGHIKVWTPPGAR